MLRGSPVLTVAVVVLVVLTILALRLGWEAAGPSAGRCSLSRSPSLGAAARDAALKHEDDAREGGPVGHAGPAALRLGMLLGQEWFDNFPQLVAYQLFSHAGKGSSGYGAGFARRF